MGLDELHLRVLATSSENPKEKRNAQKGSFHHVPCHSKPLIATDHLTSLVLNLLRLGRHWVLVVSCVSPTVVCTYTLDDVELPRSYYFAMWFVKSFLLYCFRKDN